MQLSSISCRFHCLKYCIPFPAHWFLADKPCIFNEEEGKLALFTTTNNFFTLSPPFSASPHFYCFPPPLACGQALRLGKKSLFPLPSSPLDQWPVYRLLHHHHHMSIVFPPAQPHFLKWWQTTQKWVETVHVALQWRKRAQIQCLNTDTGRASSSKQETTVFEIQTKRIRIPPPTLISGNWLSPLWESRSCFANVSNQG